MKHSNIHSKTYIVNKIEQLIVLFLKILTANKTNKKRETSLSPLVSLLNLSYLQSDKILILLFVKEVLGPLTIAL